MQTPPTIKSSILTSPRHLKKSTHPQTSGDGIASPHHGYHEGAMPTQTPFGPCAPVPCDLTWYGETTSAKIDSALSDQALRLFSSGALGSDRSGGISANSTPPYPASFSSQ
jgi:hypothetical protein